VELQSFRKKSAQQIFCQIEQVAKSVYTPGQSEVVPRFDVLFRSLNTQQLE
jgi:hypothetical protein